MTDEAEIRESLSSAGQLAERLGYFRHRDEQVKLALAVHDAVVAGKSAVLEAGTGTGKTFAYLVPILLHGERVIISTSTKGLQEQLCNKDIPALAEALGVEVDVRLLKGRSNYLCKRRLAMAMATSKTKDLFPDDRHIDSDLRQVAAYEKSTIDGDKAGITRVKQFSNVWPLVTSTDTNCTRRSCEEFSSCFLYRAREKARQATILVVNHALLFSDAALRSERDEHGVLGDFDLVVFDEAHALPDDIPQYFATQFSTKDLDTALKEMHEGLRRSMPTEEGVLADLEVAVAKCADCCSLFTDLYKKPVNTADFRDQGLFRDFTVSLQELGEKLGELVGSTGSEEDPGNELATLRKSLQTQIDLLGVLQEEKEDSVAWAEALKEGVRFWQSPLDTATLFQEFFVAKKTCLLLSATMSVDGQLDSFKERLGMEKASELVVGSPFDYANNTMLLLPEGMPDPNQDKNGFVAALVSLAAELVQANNGAAFILFSSWQNLRIAVRLLRRKLGSEYTLLVQGEAPPDQLVRDFRMATSPHVLLGTRSFWQGVDVRGKSLSLVVLDKIPFAPPDDPYLAAVAARHTDGFMQLQLPKATLILKQAAGRLIRGEDDQGVLVICDPRMRKRKYGEIIRRSLPPMPLTVEVAEAVDFLSKIRA